MARTLWLLRVSMGPAETDSSYRHVGPRAHEGVGHGVNQLPTDPKVTELDLPT